MNKYRWRAMLKEARKELRCKSRWCDGYFEWYRLPKNNMSQLYRMLK